MSAKWNSYSVDYNIEDFRGKNLMAFCKEHFLQEMESQGIQVDIWDSYVVSEEDDMMTVF